MKQKQIFLPLVFKNNLIALCLNCLGDRSIFLILLQQFLMGALLKVGNLGQVKCHPPC